jgi:hypothetical protein
VSFPTLLILESNGSVAAVQRTRTVEGFARTLDLLEERDALRATESQSAAQAVRLFLIDMELGSLTSEAARERREQLSGISEQQARITDQLLVNLEVGAVLKEHGRTSKTAEALIEMHGAGRIPTERAAVDYWLNILYFLQGADDKRFESMVEALERAAEKDPTLLPYLERFRR